MSRSAYDIMAAWSASRQIITLKRLLEEAEERNSKLQAENERLRENNAVLMDISWPAAGENNDEG